MGQALRAPVAVSGQPATRAATAPSRDISPPINVTAFRRSFPEQWAQYLRDNFKTAKGVERAFPGIDAKTARDWIGGKRDPSGSFVATVIARDPDAIKTLGPLP